MISFILNNEIVKTDLPTGYVLLDFIRKNKRLTGTKEGCREGDCGACTVLVGELSNNRMNYKTVNSCLFPLGDAHNKHIVTIEGLNSQSLNYLQERFVAQGGTQCGFCTPGFIVSSIGYLINANVPNIDDAIEYIGGNICRCTGYAGIRRAVSDTVEYLNNMISRNGENTQNRIQELVDKKFLPDYFLTIPERLKELTKEQVVSNNEKEIVSGGTDLYVQRWESLVEKDIYLLSTQKELKGIKIIDDEIHIGAASTISEIEESEIIQQSLPELKNCLKLFGSKQIRNRATIGGNIVNASPIADMVNILLVLDAKLQLVKNNQTRILPIRDFYIDYKKLNKEKDELIKSVIFKIPSKPYLFNYEKISRRTYLDIASVNSSFFAYIDNSNFVDVKISAGGVAPVPLFLQKTSSFLNGKKINLDNILESIEIALNEISPISDARGSANYKRLLLRQLLLAHFEKFFPDLISVELVLNED